MEGTHTGNDGLSGVAERRGISGVIFDLKRFAIHDGPGSRTTVFLKGCPLRCRWCHNPESRTVSPQLSVTTSRCIVCHTCLPSCTTGALGRNGGPVVDWPRCDHCGSCAVACPTETLQMIGRSIGLDDLIEELGRDEILYDESGGGVTFSGGEPLLQGKFLLSSLRACKEKGWHTAVDTSGYGPVEVLTEAAPWTDLFLYDLKIMDPSLHEEHVGVDNNRILHNLLHLESLGACVIIRLPMIPGCTATEQNVHAVSTFLRTQTRFRHIHLLNYHSHGRSKFDRLGLVDSLPSLKPLSPEEMASIGDRLRADGFDVVIGG